MKLVYNEMKCISRQRAKRSDKPKLKIMQTKNRKKRNENTTIRIIMNKKELKNCYLVSLKLRIP